MKKFCRFIVLLIFFMFLFGILTGCTTEQTVLISTNQFTQTNYDYNCLENDKTFTEIILCYQTQDNAEKAQNKITNDLIESIK